MVSPLTDSITSLLTKFLDVQSRRAEVVASNLANADTPGYVAKELDFADYMREAAQEALNPSASSMASKSFIQTPHLIEQTPGAVGIDGNTVDAGREMSTLAEAGTQYLAGTQLLQSRLRTLRTAIREGR
ncbi:MAG: flagellar basal body rod protein FlgB [Acidobacteriota bacterium]|nr:flagellar basal body rod protein FlgB [Acidobacteriota bacterium]